MSASGSSGPSLGAVRTVARNAVYSIVPNVLLNLSNQARNLITNPRRTILGVVVGFAVTNFVNPIFNGVFATGEALVDTVLLIAFGADRAVGPQGQLGIVDLPIWFVTTLVAAFRGPAASILAIIQSFNVTVGQVAAQAGIAAPAVVTVLYAAQIAAVLYVLWAIIQVIDVPFVELSGLVSIVMAPINALRNFIR